MSKKKVSFNDIPLIIYEPPELAEELHQSRKSEYLKKKADLLRYEKLLTPIFNSLYRKKILLQNNLY
jgi:hypothetical protein